MKPDPARRWRRIARGVATRVNLAWWLQTLAAPLLLTGIAGCCALLLARRGLPDTPALHFAGGTLAALALLALACWWIARRRFESAEQSLVRLEDRMGLNASLSAAHAGITPWPDPPAHIDAGLRWNWKRVLVAPLAALAFLLAGHLVPLPAGATTRPLPDREPTAWREIEADLDRLEQEQVADEPYLEEMRERIEELRSQDEEEWFDHSSLEATDSLEESHQRELGRFGRELDRMDRTLGTFQEHSGTLDSARRGHLLEQFQQSLEGLAHGSLRPNSELLEQLRQLDPSKLGTLSPEQVEQLRRKLRQGAQACQECQGQGEGEGQGPGGEAGEGAARGGISRGPGEAGGVLGDAGQELATGELQPLASEDLSNSLPGDLLELQERAPELDHSDGSRSGGTIDHSGIGGDRVWRESLDPDEQRALKRYFE